MTASKTPPPHLPAQTFWPHQKDALKYTHNKKSIALYMEMRLGKTKVACTWWHRLRLPKKSRTLVVPPYSAFQSWVHEFNAMGISPIELIGTKKKREKILSENPHGVFILNHDGHRPLPKIKCQDWECAIIDESYFIKNPKSGNTKFFLEFRHGVKYRAILTGAPAPEGEEDFFTQMVFAFDSFQGHTNFWKWRNARHIKDPDGYGYIIPIPEMRAIKKEVHRLAFCLTRKEAGQFEEKVYERIYVKQTPEQKKASKKLLATFEAHVRNEHMRTKWVPVVGIMLRRIAGGYTSMGTLLSAAKHRWILEFWKVQIKREPILIWAYFKTEQYGLRDWLRSKGVRAECINGDVKPKLRLKIVEDWKAGKFDALICQQQTMRHGADLSYASAAVYYSNMPHGEARIQTEDRTVHFAKKDASLIVDLCTADSVDAELADMVRVKESMNRHYLTHVQTMFN